MKTADHREMSGGRSHSHNSDGKRQMKKGVRQWGGDSAIFHTPYEIRRVKYDRASKLSHRFLLSQVLKILDARQFREVFQSELDHKLLRRAVHHRAADGFFSALGDDQPFF